MNKRKGKLLIYVVACILLFSIQTAYAQSFENDSGSRKLDKEKIAARIAEELDLSDEQREQLKVKRAEHRNQMKELK